MFIGFVFNKTISYGSLNFKFKNTIMIFHASNNLTPKFRDFYCNNQDKTVHCERVGLCE